MNWMLTADRDKVHHPNSIISFCCHHVLPITKSDTLYGFTEHRRIDQENGQQHIFRAHPSYQSTSGQATGIWYDWAMFQLEDETIPCQIMCFLNIDYLKDNAMQTVRGYVIDQNGLYAVVRRFKNTPRPLSERSIISTGEIEDGFISFPVIPYTRRYVLCQIILQRSLMETCIISARHPIGFLSSAINLSGCHHFGKSFIT